MDAVESQRVAALLYDRLRGLARARMAGERAGHTLDATGLANEAILRLLRCAPGQIRDEQHFMVLAAEAMRHVLVEHARARQRQKRGGGRPVESLTGAEDAVQLNADPAEIVALSDALATLDAEDEQAATIVKMRSFAGMPCDEIAALLNMSRRTVERRWRYAMARLRAELSGDESYREPA